MSIWKVVVLAVIATANTILAEPSRTLSFGCGVKHYFYRNHRQYTTVECWTKETAGSEELPEWRLYGASDDELMAYEVGRHFEFEAPTDWHLLEMRVGNYWARGWIRERDGRLEKRDYGKEK